VGIITLRDFDFFCVTWERLIFFLQNYYYVKLCPYQNL